MATLAIAIVVFLSLAMAGGWALERRFEPQMAPDERDRRYEHWQRAVRAAMAV